MKTISNATLREKFSLNNWPDIMPCNQKIVGNVRANKKFISASQHGFSDIMTKRLDARRMDFVARPKPNNSRFPLR